MVVIVTVVVIVAAIVMVIVAVGVTVIATVAVAGIVSVVFVVTPAGTVIVIVINVVVLPSYISMRPAASRCVCPGSVRDVVVSKDRKNCPREEKTRLTDTRSQLQTYPP